MASLSPSHEFLGALANALSIVIKEHEPTKKMFEIFKTRMGHFSSLINEKVPGEVEIVLTGSSYDDLHMCRYLKGLHEKQEFFPETDFDFMTLYKTFPVEDFTDFDESKDMQTLKDKCKTSNCAAIMVPSNHKGYVKLMITKTGKEIIEKPKCRIGKYVDSDGYILNDVFTEDWKVEEESGVDVLYRRTGNSHYTVSGPALTNIDAIARGVTQDFVRGFPCAAWPTAAERWAKRKRDANWPSKQMMEDILKDGCVVVPVGYYTSPEKEREWRLSFNLAERKLSKALSRNQRTCYCLVKLMIKSQLSPQAILSSYMVKNMMFWFCEQQYGEDEWGDDSVGVRIMQLIDYICVALEHHNIPHFFLPWSNLIAHKSKEDAETTLVEIKQMCAKPMETLVQICEKLQLFEIRKQHKAAVDESSQGLILYQAIVAILFQLGALNTDVKPFATRCFTAVVTLNHASQFMSLRRSQPLACTSIPQLLKPLALQNMQSGQFDVALALYHIMLDSDKKLVEERYPETFTNMGCLYANIADMVTGDKEKESCCTKADQYFLEALRYIQDSPGLHLAYGNFLKEKMRGVARAVAQFKSALSIDKTRDDDEALVQITVPGKTTVEYVPGKVVAYYLLIDLLVRLEEIFEARQYANKFESFVASLPLKHRDNGFNLCFVSHLVAGLNVKAQLVKKRATKSQTS